MQTARTNHVTPLPLAFASKLLADQHATKAGKRDTAPRFDQPGKDKGLNLRPGRWPNGEVVMLPTGCAG